MSKTIIKEVPPEQTNAEWYFDGDCFNENSGDYNNTIFILTLDHYHMYPCCVNVKEFKNIQSEIGNIVYEVNEGIGYGYKNVKEIMKDYKLKYNPKNAHKLKEIADDGDYEDSEVIAKYMTLKTGKKWGVSISTGYCQGDFVEVIYCTENYTDKDVAIFGDMANGCFKEFGVIDLDDDGNEIDSCYGYYVADSETYDPTEIKRLVCKWSGADFETTELHMCGSCHTVTTYDYDVY